jgi:ribosomal protein S18 acetylase RimI-like enzyme
VPTSADFTLLDNPIWNSLGAGHAHLAISSPGGLARRYPADIGPLSGLREPTPAAFADLASIIPEGDLAALFLEARPEIPSHWEFLRDGTLVQMICEKIIAAPPIEDPIVPLEPSDFPEMLALASLTEPGPFRANTASLGGFVGIRVSGRLAAMAGRRLSPTGFTEVSAVCTHLEFRGRGYARTLVAAVARGIADEGRVPFLTSFESNVGAVRVYEQVGFTIRRRFDLAVVKPPARTE